MMTPAMSRGVSVVIPAYNRAGLVLEAARSALAQDWTPLEVIVVDDASNDDTVARLMEVAADEPRLRVIACERNEGPSYARNKGIAAARYEYVALLDSDNRFVEGKLRRQMQLLERGPEGSVVFSAYTGVADGQRSNVLIEHWSERPPDVVEQLLAGCCVNTSTFIAPRRVLIDVGMFRTDLICAEDHDLWLRLAAAGHNFLYHPEPLATYLVHENNLSADPAQVAACSELVIGSFLSRSDLPAEIRRDRKRYIARWALNSAVGYLAAGDGREALAALWRAIRVAPSAARPGWALMALRAAGQTLRSLR
jgi:glycosyltransferase involved in cell wall biosynthesis